VSSGGAPIVTLYLSPGCHLCDRAHDVLAEARDEVGFGLVEVDITDDPELEARYREWLPVVEIDGERAFVYHVDPGGLRKKLARMTGAD
jgi:glutaredoxin